MSEALGPRPRLYWTLQDPCFSPNAVGPKSSKEPGEAPARNMRWSRCHDTVILYPMKPPHRFSNEGGDYGPLLARHRQKFRVSVRRVQSLGGAWRFFLRFQSRASGLGFKEVRKADYAQRMGLAKEPPSGNLQNLRGVWAFSRKRSQPQDYMKQGLHYCYWRVYNGFHVYIGCPIGDTRI